MATILEALKKFNINFDDSQIFKNFTSEDLPYLILTSMLPGSDKETIVYGLLLAMAIRIEELENEVFSLKFENKE